MTTDEIIMTRPKEQDYFIRATYVRQLENYCDELENEIIEQLAERDELRAKLAELDKIEAAATQEPLAFVKHVEKEGYATVCFNPRNPLIVGQQLYAAPTTL